MSVDFFNTSCKEPTRKDELFGICDDQDGTKAYTDIEDTEKWIAKVNNNNREVEFTAIDNCIEIINEETEQQESTCDGMLTFGESIYLVELKNKQKRWLSKAIEQLENTIKIITENHDIGNYKYKKAYACNKRFPNFTKSDIETKRRFFYETDGFIIINQVEIVIN